MRWAGAERAEGRLDQAERAVPDDGLDGEDVACPHRPVEEHLPRVGDAVVDCVFERRCRVRGVAPGPDVGHPRRLADLRPREVGDDEDGVAVRGEETAAQSLGGRLGHAGEVSEVRPGCEDGDGRSRVPEACLAVPGSSLVDGHGHTLGSPRGGK